jgi:predicted transcriptional regulator
MSFFLFASPLGTQSSSLGLVAIWLAVLNLLLGVINMLPGLPLDGGRVFHAIMWRATGNYFKGMLAATAAGQIIGIFSIILGLTLFALQEPSLFGLAGWFFLVGWFLRRAAKHNRNAAIRNEALKNLRASDALQVHWPQVQSSVNVLNLAQDNDFINGKQSYLVYDGDDWVGIIPVRIVKALSAGEQSALRIVELMVHHTEVFTAAPHDNLNLILEKMETDRLGYIPVIENTKVIGVVAREKLLDLATEHSPMR